MHHLIVIFFPSYFAKSHWRSTQQTEGALGETQVCTFCLFFSCELNYFTPTCWFFFYSFLTRYQKAFFSLCWFFFFIFFFYEASVL